MNAINRREALRLSAESTLALSLAGSGLLSSNTAAASESTEPDNSNKNRTLPGLLVLPGQWRPNWPFEQIAWVRTPWCTAWLPDFIILDFPEAIFCDQGLLYLSHGYSPPAQMFADLPRVPWRQIDDGLRFERQLPNGVVFGGSLLAKQDVAPIAGRVQMKLFIKNGGRKPLRKIQLQTCSLLKHCTEFRENTLNNKFVSVAGKWIPMSEAKQASAEGKFRIGWRSGPKAADLPVLVTKSSRAQRLVAMTWYDDTFSLIGNPLHPCMHADPRFPDLLPGDRAEITGQLVFFDGSLPQFGEWFKQHERES